MSGESTKDEMSFLDHLEELRWHLIRSVLAILIIATAAFVFKDFIFDVKTTSADDCSEFDTNSL